MGAIEYVIAKNQEISLKVNDYWIHSRYNPSQEANKFIEQVILPTYKDGKILFIIGSALGYVEAILQKNYPHILFVSYDFTQYDARHVVYKQKKSLPTNRVLLRSVLGSLVNDENCGLYQLVIWSATSSAYDECTRIVSNHFAQMQSSSQTLAHFGWRWLRNGVKNFLHWEKQIILPTVRSICLIGSGAGLLEAIPYLQKMRGYYFIFAVSSSVYTLRSYGIEPDLVINIDGGFYAKQHLAQTQDLPVINALLGATTLHNDTSMLSLGSFFENWVEKRINILPKGRWAGTVTVTAIDLALSMAKDEVILIGLDFALSHGYTHAKPHVFFDNFRNTQERLNPLPTQYYVLESHSVSTLAQYRNWFISQQWSAKLKRFTTSEYDLGIQKITHGEFCKKHTREDFAMRYQPVLTYDLRRQYLLELLKNWEMDPLPMDLVNFLFVSEKIELSLAQNRKDFTTVRQLKNDLKQKVQDRLLILKDYLG